MSDACCADRTTADEIDGDDDDDVTSIWGVSEIRAGLVAGTLLLAAFLLGLSGQDGWALGLNIGALVVGASTFVPETLKKLSRGKIGVGTLMTIAAVGAVILGEFAEAATLAFLYSLSEGLEEYSLAKTRGGLRALLSLVPDTATVRRAGVEQVIDPADLVVGDTMLVLPGERLATDGTIRAGRTTLDVSAITG